ncbi:hypothetical protein [Arthrobacter sp. JSM 101049]|uniref:hypothetical protein n=1 Tax=Arthrobacter sp. JSM 101049 TaxID=929097 RepID=UPI003564F3A4
MIGFFDAVKAMFPTSVRTHLFAPSFSKVQDGQQVPTLADYPYVVLWGTPGTEYSGDGPLFPSLRDAPDAVSLDVRVTYVATSSTSLDWLLSRARPALNRQVPVVPGYQVGRIRLESLTNITPDNDVSIGSLHPLFTVDEFTLTASRIQ